MEFNQSSTSCENISGACRNASPREMSRQSFRVALKARTLVVSSCVGPKSQQSQQSYTLKYFPVRLSRFRGQHRVELGPTLQCSAAAPLAEGGGTLWAILTLSAGSAQVISNNTQIGSLLSAPLLAIMFGLFFAALGVVPLSCTAYTLISSQLVPLAAALYLLESDLRELASTGRSTLIAFALATVGTILGTLVAWQLVGSSLGKAGYKVVAALAASYIGGSVNFAAVSAAFGLTSSGLMAAAMSADMIAMAAYLALLTWWPVSESVDLELPGSISTRRRTLAGASTESLSVSLAAAVVACASGSALASWLAVPDFSLAFVAVAASLFASAAGAIQSRWHVAIFQGSEALGGTLMTLFFFTIGAAAGSILQVLSTGWLLIFIVIQLAVHLAVTAGIGSWLGLPMQAILTASNAAVGGPGTAAAMATARKWPAMVRPALVVGALGYSIGTGIGICLGQLLQPA